MKNHLFSLCFLLSLSIGCTQASEEDPARKATAPVFSIPDISYYGTFSEQEASISEGYGIDSLSFITTASHECNLHIPEESAPYLQEVKLRVTPLADGNVETLFYLTCAPNYTAQERQLTVIATNSSVPDRTTLLLIKQAPIAEAHRKYASTIQALNNLAAEAVAGDVITLACGEYTDAALTIRGTATAERPIVIRGEEPGAVCLTGGSSLSVGGSYIEVHDLWFKEVTPANGSARAVIELRTSAATPATHCRITNCTITARDQPEDPTLNRKWVSIYGSENRIDHCHFSDKKDLGTLLVVWLSEGTRAAHSIDHNYFSRPISFVENGSTLNGQETIRIGDSSTSLQAAQCTVSDNHFYACNGEVEIISNKSCFNTYIRNLFEVSEGTLTLRHGNDCTVTHNYFIGENKPKTGGVRVIGERHTITDNLFYQLGGANYNAALCFVKGVENPELSSYFQVTDATIANNRFILCQNALNIHYGGGTLPVIHTQITNNLIWSSDDQIAVRLTTPPIPQIAWENNRICGGTYQGITDEELPRTEQQPIVIDESEYRPISQNAGVSYTTDLP